MGRKRLWIFAAVACMALAGAGIAAATHSRTASAQSATAGFDATTVSVLKQVTCSIAGGDSFEGTNATYTGTATSADPRLDGALTIRAQSVIDTTTGRGRVSGVFRIVGADGDNAKGTFSSAVSDGLASGLARAELHQPWGHLVATLASGFDPSSGFSNGLLGSGVSTGSGVVISAGYCHRAVRSHVRKHR